MGNEPLDIDFVAFVEALQRTGELDDLTLKSLTRNAVHPEVMRCAVEAAQQISEQAIGVVDQVHRETEIYRLRLAILGVPPMDCIAIFCKCVRLAIDELERAAARTALAENG